jgi:hypothetical protein
MLEGLARKSQGKGFWVSNKQRTCCGLMCGTFLEEVRYQPRVLVYKIGCLYGPALVKTRAISGEGEIFYEQIADPRQGGTIRTSINLPAQSFYQSRKTLLDLCQRAGIDKVIFYCGMLIIFSDHRHVVGRYPLGQKTPSF